MELTGHDNGVEHSVVYLINIQLWHPLVGRWREIIFLNGFLNEVKVADVVAAIHLSNILITNLLAMLLGVAGDDAVGAEHLNRLLILRFVTFLQCFWCLHRECQRWTSEAEDGVLS